MQNPCQRRADITAQRNRQAAIATLELKPRLGFTPMAAHLIFPACDER
jgi:hypothetical protein